MLSKFVQLVVNGFFPSITIKNVSLQYVLIHFTLNPWEISYDLISDFKEEVGFSEGRISDTITFQTKSDTTENND
jgi:hypothetical protein